MTSWGRPAPGLPAGSEQQLPAGPSELGSIIGGTLIS